MTAQRHEYGGGGRSSACSHEAAPETFYAKKMRSLSDPYPYTAVRVEVRDGDFTLLSVHWSAALALKEVGERLARGEQAAAYLVRWDRIESDNDPRLKEMS
jgi:glutathione S-transferase